jgi:hypothetical protein
MVVLLTGVGLLTLTFAALSWWLLTHRRIDVRSYAGVAVLFLWVIGVVVKLGLDHVADPIARGNAIDLARAVQASAWAKQDAPSPAPLADAATGNGPVAPIDSLVGGLEARLAENPGDANGWVLLAQSYAFLNDQTRAEHAVQRAVALGVDEGTLRARIDLAKREPHASLGLGGSD